MRQDYKLLLSALIISTVCVLPPTLFEQAKKQFGDAKFKSLLQCLKAKQICSPAQPPQGKAGEQEANEGTEVVQDLFVLLNSLISVTHPDHKMCLETSWHSQIAEQSQKVG